MSREGLGRLRANQVSNDGRNWACWACIGEDVGKKNGRRGYDNFCQITEDPLLERRICFYSVLLFHKNTWLHAFFLIIFPSTSLKCHFLYEIFRGQSLYLRLPASNTLHSSYFFKKYYYIFVSSTRVCCLWGQDLGHIFVFHHLTQSRFSFMFTEWMNAWMFLVGSFQYKISVKWRGSSPSLFYWWGNWGSGRTGDSRKVTQLVKTSEVVLQTGSQVFLLVCQMLTSFCHEST